MKTILKHITYSIILICIVQNIFAQQVNINQKELPYSIPVIENPSSGINIQYQWLENGKIIIGANSPKYTIPSGKSGGTYAYINQIRCSECTDWLSSNPFTVNIYGTSKLKSASVPTASLSASFCPQKELYGYLDKLISVIDNAQQSIDIDLYSFENYDVFLALKRATARGVQIRLLYEGALEDHKKADSTVSHQIEAIGIDVRYVNKTNHHKFVISDKNYLVTSSGNWNNEANSVYDENTLWINDNELVLRYRAEFEHLWNNSREFGISHTWPVVNTDSLLNQIVDNPNVDAIFTSSNYRTYISGTYGSTFASISGKQNVADRIVELINHSQHSIKIAANHLRSRPIAEALIAKKSQNPQIDIQVYLDGQEYISEGYNNYQKTKRDECLAGATTPGQIRDCMEKDFYYSYELILAGIDVRFKTYSYKWDASTSALMHHKYAVFDDSIVATGSYNYSFNAETNSMENVVIFNRIASDNSVTDYISNFGEIWNTGRQEGYYNDLSMHISSDSRYIPVLFLSMSLSPSEVTSLKQQIESACPTVTNDFFSDNRQYFSTFLRDVALTYDANKRITKAQDSKNNGFSVNYSYNGQNAITGVAFQSSDGSSFEENYQYDGNKNITGLSSPLFNLNLTYNNNELLTLDAGRGAHSWLSENNANGTLTRYSIPGKQDYIKVLWNNNGLPTNVTDADNRFLKWEYNDNDGLSSITTSGRSIQFTEDNTQSQYNTVSSDGESIAILQPSLDELNISTMGTVASNIKYISNVQTDNKQTLNIEITSNNVASGTGKKATIDYLLDSYGRVANSGSLAITRKPYSGNILTVSNGAILETRTYNDWELLTEQSVTFNGIVVYKANYQYNALQRIKQVTEILSGETSLIEYTYNAAGQLVSVNKNNVLIELYSYDAYGNRISANTSGYNYTYTSNTNNKLTSYSWVQSGSTRLKEFAYNNSGQLSGTINKTVNGSSSQVTSSKNYSYDIFGNLNSVAWASQNLQYKYDTYDRQIATIQNGSVKRKLVYGLGNLPLAELNENDRIINTFVYADSYTPLLMRKGNTDYYLVSDIRGSVRMVVKVSDGSVRQKIDYDAFGEVISDNNPGYTPFGHAGGLYDYRTDLTRFGARDYYPEIGRWTSEDPMGFLSGDVNFYAYCANDPVNFVDPSGFSVAPNSNLAIVIGERMNRVNRAANDLRSQGYNVKTYTPRNFRSTPGKLSPLDVKANRTWLSYWTQKRGAKVFDIGIEQSTKNRSPFYEMENKSIYTNWKYGNVIKLPGY